MRGVCLNLNISTLWPRSTVLNLDLERGICGRARTASKTECPRQTGPLARVSGRDSVPPAKRRWVPPSSLRHQDVLSQENRNDLIFRKVRGILNKLTPENFKKLSDDLLGTELNSSVILKGVILLIFDKALDEPKYSSMYAQLCKRLSKEAPNFEPDDQPCTFRLLLLNKCKAEFENRSQASEAFDRDHGNGLFTPEDEERRQLAKRKMLGNIKFIGELAKLEILSESILHKCILQLLVDKRRRGDTAQDMSEDLECLCQILRTCGRILDTDKGKKLMDQYFERMKVLTDNMELPPRIRFMLKDVIELRYDGWVPRKATTVEGPMPINQIRPADDDPRAAAYNLMRERRNQERDADRVGSNELFRHRMKIRSGIEDMLAGISIGSSSTNLIPTHGADKFNSFNPNGYGVREGSFRGHNNQRSGGYNMYNNQRGGTFNKHNQNNQHSNNTTQYNNASNKELAPRFKKSLIAASQQNLGDLELRPAANSMLFNQASMKAVPNTNMVMNSNRTPATNDLNISVSSNSNKNVMPATTPLLKEPLPIKQASTEKPKQMKKDKGPNKEEVLKKLTSLIDEYLQDNMNITQALEAYKEHKIPDKYAKDVMIHVLNMCMDKSQTDSNREKIIKFITTLRNDNLVNAITCQDAIKNFCNNLDESEGDTPHEKGAVVLACAIRDQILGLCDVATLTENGAHHPLFLLVLQQLHKVLDKQELVDLFNASKVNLMSQLPKVDRTKERLAEILEDRDLTFLYPLLRIQAELAKQLQADPQPTQFYKWIKDNLDQASYNDRGFINALMTVLLKYMMQEAGSVAVDTPDKIIQEKEKALLKRYTVVLRHFLHEKVNLQVTAVYSLQAHCHGLGFPKGLLLRWFMALYDLEVVEEEAFLQWKEDLTDEYPGKGEALFQVNQWLTWLQEAESEDEDVDD